MFDARELLGKLLDSGAAPAGKERIENAIGEKGLAGSGSPLKDLFGAFSGGGGFQGGLDKLTSQAGQIFGQVKEGVQGGNPLAIGGLAALAGAVLGGGGGAARGAVGGGVLALVGSIAWSALKRQQAGAAASEGPPQLTQPSSPEGDQAAQTLALLMIRAMIAAAKADGEIDAGERDAILGKLAELGAGEEEQTFVREEMQRPIDINALLAEVQNPETAAQFYAASLLAIKVDTPAEEDYLRRLANALKLDAETIGSIRATMGAPALSPA